MELSITNWKQWLKASYSETPTDGPDAKRVKFSDMHESLMAQFPTDAISKQMASRAIQEAFPNTEKQRLGRDKNTYIVGIQPPVQVHPSNSIEVLQAQNQQLTETVHQLQARIRELEEPKSTSLDTLLPSMVYSYSGALSTEASLSSTTGAHQVPSSQIVQQMDALTQHGVQILHGPDTPNNFSEFSMDVVTSELQSIAPDVYQLFVQLGNTDRNKSDDETQVEERKAIMSLCTILNARSRVANGLQLLLSFMLIARATSRQAIAVLNHAGVCVSYNRAWQYLRQLTTEARYLEVVRGGHWMWVYDNVNIHQKVRHEREDKHSKMLNLTARLAVQIQNLPDWEIDWNDTTPQRDPSTLTITDILPNEGDGQELKKRAVQYVMQFLVTEFSCLNHLKSFLRDKESPHCVNKSNVVPMKILFKDEKYKAETVDILSRLVVDAQLSGIPEILVGDQLTCKVIRGAKRWREADTSQKERLTWAFEVPGDFHFLWECLKVLLMMFWGSPNHIGSLCNLREYVRRVQVDKNGKVFNVCDEFILHAFKSHLLAAICTQLKLQSLNTPIVHDRNLQWLETTAEAIVMQNLYPTTSTDTVYGLHRSFLHMAYLYMDLRDAIRYEDGEHIIRHWKWWLPRFIAVGCKNYATEAANLIANVTARFPKHIAYITIHNRTVNMDGRLGHGKPVDQLMEHYNLVLKQALRSSGANATDKHIEDVSLCSMFLMEAAKKADKEFGVPSRSTKHTIREASADIKNMAMHLIDHKVTVQTTGRTSSPFRDVTDDGFKKMSQSWLKQVLTQPAAPPDDDQEPTLQGDIELDYELHDVV